MTPAQRQQYLPAFMADHFCHLALIRHAPDAELGWKYHREIPEASVNPIQAQHQNNGDSVDSNNVAKLRVAEAVAGFERHIPASA